MEIAILIMSIILIVLLVVFICLYLKNNNDKKIEEINNANNSSANLNEKLFNFERNILGQMNTTFDSIQIKLDQRLNLMDTKMNSSLEKGFTNTNKSYEDMIQRLAKIDEAQRNIDKLSGSVTSLTSVLENNQNRGKFGEFTLERILFSIFGDAKKGTYELQYVLKEQDLNERPDAVVFLPEPQKLICIDSKFPYQDYKRLIELKDDSYKNEFAKAVKLHINAISSKYIIDGVTSPTAFMFIPSDAIFGFINGELYEVVEYARKKHVIMVSPSTLQPILATINMVQIDDVRNKNVTFIIDQLRKLSVDFQKFLNDWNRFSKNLNQTINVKEEFDNRVNQIIKKFQRIEKIEGSSESENEEAS